MRTIHRAAAVAALALAAPALSQTATPLIAAAAQLKAKLDSAPADGAPTLRNADAALIRTAFNADTVRALPVTDLVTTSRACVAIGEAIVAYVGYGQRVTANDADPDKASDALFAQLQDEVVLGVAAGNICVKRAFRAVEPVFAKLTGPLSPQRTAGLKQMRDGATQTLDGTLATIVAPETTAANRTKLLDAMLEDAPFLAMSFPAAERQAIRQDILKQIAAAPAAAKPKLTRLAAAFAPAGCNALCKAAGTK